MVKYGQSIPFQLDLSDSNVTKITNFPTENTHAANSAAQRIANKKYNFNDQT